MDTDFFARQMEVALVGLRQGRKLLADAVSAELDPQVVGEVQKHLRRRGEALSRRDVLSLRPAELSRIAGVSDEKARWLRLELMGVALGHR